MSREKGPNIQAPKSSRTLASHVSFITGTTSMHHYLVMYFDIADANMLNLAHWHERSDRAAAPLQTLVTGIPGIWELNVIKHLVKNLAANLFLMDYFFRPHAIYYCIRNLYIVTMEHLVLYIYKIVRIVRPGVWPMGDLPVWPVGRICADALWCGTRGPVTFRLNVVATDILKFWETDVVKSGQNRKKSSKWHCKYPDKLSKVVVRNGHIVYRFSVKKKKLFIYFGSSRVRIVSRPL